MVYNKHKILGRVLTMDTKFLQDLKLKQTIISDAQAAKPRLQAAWKTLDDDAKDMIVAMSGAALSSINRARRSGQISAKLVVPFAMASGVSPFYLCGLSDEQAACDDAEIKRFLKNFGYDVKLKPGPKPKKSTNEKPPRRKKADAEQPAEKPTIDDAPGKTATAPLAPQAEPGLPFSAEGLAGYLGTLSEAHRAYIDGMSYDDIVAFVVTLMKKAGYDEKSKQILGFVKLLLSLG